MNILYLFLLAILLGTYWYVLKRVIRNSFGLTPLLGWLVGIGFFLVAPLAILTLNGGFKQPAVYDVNGTWDEVNLGSLMFFRPYLVIWLSLMLTVGAALMFGPSRASKTDFGLISRRKLTLVILATMLLAAVDWLIAIWLQGGVSQFLLSNWYTRNSDLGDRFGVLFVAYTRLSLINQMIFTAATALYASLGLKERNTRGGFTALILFFILLEIVMSGNRIFFALYLLAFLTSCWLYGRKKILAALLLVSPALVLVFSLWGAVRADLSKIPDSASSQALEVDVGNRAVTHLIGVTEGSGVMLLMHMINDFGTKFNYLYGATYARIFTFLLPSSIYPVRPPDFTTLAAQLYEPGQTLSLGSTALGEAYANFGFAGILVLPVLTWFAVVCGQSISRSCGNHSLVSAVSFVMFVAFVRFPFAENAMTWFGALVIIWIFRFENGIGLLAKGSGTPTWDDAIASGPPPVPDA